MGHYLIYNYNIHKKEQTNVRKVLTRTYVWNIIVFVRKMEYKKQPSDSNGVGAPFYLTALPNTAENTAKIFYIFYQLLSRLVNL